MNIKKNMMVSIFLFAFLVVGYNFYQLFSSQQNQMNSVVYAANKSGVDVKQYQNMVKPMFQNKAFEEAWTDYVKVLDSVKLSNSFSTSSEGTGPKEFDKLGLVKGRPKESEFGKKGKIRLYTYETDKPFNKEVGKKPGTANLITIYEKDHLVFVGLTNNSFIFSQDNLLAQKKVESLVKGPFEYKNLKNNKAIVTTFGTILVNNKQYSVVSMPSGEAKQPTVEYFALKDGKMDYITTRFLSEVVENDIVHTMDAINQYIQNDSNEFYQMQAPKEETTKEKE